MTPQDASPVSRDRTFTEVARREQIVRAAIATVARFGYAATTLGKITKTAGLSSVGMISYYFDGKAELMAEVVATVLAEANAEVAPRIAQAGGGVDALRTYIEASLDHIAEHREAMVALFEITTGSQESHAGHSVDSGAMAILTDLVTAAQTEIGSPQSLSPEIVAHAIRGAIHRALAPGLRTGETIEWTLDLRDYGRQIADLIERSLRFTPPEGDQP